MAVAAAAWAAVVLTDCLRAPQVSSEVALKPRISVFLPSCGEAARAHSQSHSLPLEFRMFEEDNIKYFFSFVWWKNISCFSMFLHFYVSIFFSIITDWWSAAQGTEERNWSCKREGCWFKSHDWGWITNPHCFLCVKDEFNAEVKFINTNLCVGIFWFFFFFLM